MLKQTPILKSTNSLVTAPKTCYGKFQALNLIKPHAEGLSLSTQGFVRRELGFKYRDSI